MKEREHNFTVKLCFVNRSRLLHAFLFVCLTCRDKEIDFGVKKRCYGTWHRLAFTHRENLRTKKNQNKVKVCCQSDEKRRSFALYWECVILYLLMLCVSVHFLSLINFPSYHLITWRR